MYTMSKITIVSVCAKEKFKTLQKLNRENVTNPAERIEALASFGENKYLKLRGYWKEQSVKNYLMRMGLSGHVEVVHTCLNLSKGGSLDEGRFNFCL